MQLGVTKRRGKAFPSKTKEKSPKTSGGKNEGMPPLIKQNK